MTTEICRAISQRHVITFAYDGLSRVVEPYCHGRGSDGKELLRAFQIAGTSRTRGVGWKLFEVRRIVGLKVTDQEFFRRPGYNPADAAMHPVHCCV